MSGNRGLGPCRRASIALLAAVLAAGSGGLLSCATLGLGGETRIYVAQGILTMDPEQPRATAVAVRDGRIAAVGSLAEVEAALGDQRYTLDPRFADHILLPGLIEPHLHPYIGALLLPMKFVTPHDWEILGEHFPGVRGRAAYLARLRELEAAMPVGPLGGKGKWLDTWGYHHLFHGELDRAALDAISSERPILVWHRSFHEIFLNTAALEALGLSEAEVASHPNAEATDWERGHFYETGLSVAVAKLMPRLTSLPRYLGALAKTRDVIHRGGITTVSDGAFGTIDVDREWSALRFGWRAGSTPFRTFLLADGRALGERLGHEGALEQIAELTSRSTGHLIFRERAVKLFADGAFYSQLMCLGPPGYLDGHECEWLMQPDELLVAARHYWKAGYQIHVHANGDEGIDVALDVLEILQREHPRKDHRFALHHFGYSRPDQSERIARLGAVVSANPYYLWALADKYSEVGLGPERASHMVRLGSLARAGVRISLHSDFTMAPAEPLRLAAVAASRVAASGVVMAPEERLSVEHALRAVTIDAAHLLMLEDEIGSIEVGKRADFTVLERDPFEVPPAELGEIAIWGTVLGGKVWPIPR
jgi:predicted amidohydrolase YtcJ